jgi:Carboxypeptidase regulatory-like domain
MPTASRSRHGSARRIVVLASASLALLLAVLWWLFGRADEVPVAEVGARPGLGSIEAPAGELKNAAPLAAPPGPAGGVTDRATIATGVRLSGNGRLTGRVLDREGGAGVGGAKVELLPLPPAGSAIFARFLGLAGFDGEFSDRARAVATVVSAADGAFAFDGVRAGSYFVEARSDWHVPAAAVQAIVAPSGAGGPLDVWVMKGGRVLGRVERPDGTPASGAGVSLRPGCLDLIERARNGDLFFLDTRADDQGCFVLAGVPEGPAWAVAAYGPGFALSHAGDVAVVAGADTQIVIRAREGARVEGRVVAEGGEHAALEQGTPVAGAHVGVIPRGLRDLTFLERLVPTCYARTDAEGRFSLEHVPPGEVDLVGWAPGHQPSVGPSLVVDDTATSAAGDFTLTGGPSVEGRVVDGSGEPIEGARVRWRPFDTERFDFAFSFAPFLSQAVEGFAFPTTGADGHFVAGAFPGDPPYSIQVSKAGWAETEKSWTPLEEEGPIEIVLHRGGAVEGIVMDAARRAPVASFSVASEALISALPGAPGGSNPYASGVLFEDPAGRFRIEPLEPGTTRLTVSAPGYVPALTDELQIAENETVKGLIVTLHPGGAVRGRVVDESGAAVAGALVFWADDVGWKRPEGTERASSPTPRAGDMPGGLREFAAGLGLLGSATAQSHPDGTFELTGVEPGQIVVYASHRALATGQSAPVPVAAGSTVEGVEIRLTEGAGLYGKVRDRFDKPVPGVIVVAASPAAMEMEKNGASGLVYQAFTGLEGDYSIGRMAPGSYFLTTTRPDQALNPMSFLGSLNFELVTVPEGERVEYDLIDRSVGGARVHGLVTDHGEPVPGGNLIAFGFESESLLGLDFKLARIKEDGSYVFESIAPGEYRFQVGTGRGGQRETRMTVEIPEQDDVQLDLALPEGVIGGVVLDAASGEPAKEANVTLIALDAPSSGGLLGGMMGPQMSRDRRRLGDDGTFSFERLEAGRYRLDVGSPNWGDNEGRWAPIEPMDIELRRNERADDLVLRLEPSLSISGKVRGEGGEPVGGASVFAVRSDLESAARARGQADDSGEFKLRGVAPGTWTLSATADGYASGSVHGVKVEHGKDDPVELVLPRGVEVSVRVTDGTGRPVSGAAARLIPLEQSPDASAAEAQRMMARMFRGEGTSGADGRLALGRFSPGRYRLEVQRGLARALPEEVELEAGNDVELRARLP